MPYDKKQFMESMTGKLKDKIEAQSQGFAYQMELLRQAAVKSELLTNDPNWDTFLSRVQHQLNQLVAKRDAARAAMEDPKVTSYEDLMRRKIVLRECEVAITCIEIIMKFPSEIINSNKKLANDTEIM